MENKELKQIIDLTKEFILSVENTDINRDKLTAEQNYKLTEHIESVMNLAKINIELENLD